MEKYKERVSLEGIRNKNIKELNKLINAGSPNVLKEKYEHYKQSIVMYVESNGYASMDPEKKTKIINEKLMKADELGDELGLGDKLTKILKSVYSRKNFSSMSDDSKDEFINKKLERADILVSKLINEDPVKAMMQKQARYMEIIAKKKDYSDIENFIEIYKFYKLVVTNPLDSPYDAMEQEVYYNQILKMGLRAQFKEMCDMDRDNDYTLFTDSKGTSKTTGATKDKYADINEALKNAEKSIELKDWKKAKELILELPDGDDKEAFLAKYDRMLDEQAKKFEELLKQLSKEKNENKILDVNLVVELSKRYNLLKDEKKKLYKYETKRIIDYNNIYAQDARKEEVANEIETTSDWKYTFGTRLVEFLGMPVNWIRKSPAYLKHIVSKRDKAIKNKDKNLADKCEQIIAERDIPSGAIYYSRLNTLNKLKTKLYRSPNTKIKTKYWNVMPRVYNKKNKNVYSMYSREASDIINNKQRAIRVANQYMDMLAMYDISDETCSICDDDTFNGLVDDVQAYLEELKNNKTISDELYLAYMEEIDNIISYKKFVPDNRSYEYCDKDIDEISKEIVALPKDRLPYVKRWKVK